MANYTLLLIIALWITQTMSDYYEVDPRPTRTQKYAEQDCRKDGRHHLASIHTSSQNKDITNKCHDQVQKNIKIYIFEFSLFFFFIIYLVQNMLDWIGSIC